jgi:hypothetical protein
VGEAVRRGRREGLHTLVENKFYVDEIYEYLVIAPVKMSATILWFLVDRVIIDTLLVNGTGGWCTASGGALRRTHTGSINVGVVSFVAGALAALAFVAYHYREHMASSPSNADHVPAGAAGLLLSPLKAEKGAIVRWARSRSRSSCCSWRSRPGAATSRTARRSSSRRTTAGSVEHPRSGTRWGSTASASP